MPLRDFNGDGRSDILWLLHENIGLTNWLGNAGGGFSGNDANAFIWLHAMHRIDLVASGDFNGDGRSDVLWQIDQSWHAVNFASPGGGFDVGTAGPFFLLDDPAWKVAATGDFNGDGIDDLFWRHPNGSNTDWLGTASGSFVSNDSHAWSSIPLDWKVVGAGDFNGDGRDDLLWQNADGRVTNWLATAAGGFVSNDANAMHQFGNAEISIGDFDGDGRDDLAWRNTAGELFVGKTYADGAFYPQWGAGFVAKVPFTWQIEAIGDYNGDGTDDILWRNEDGVLSEWQGTKGNPYAFTAVEVAGNVAIPLEWQIAPSVF